MAWATGTRRTELVRLRLSSLSERKAGEATITIRGKGAKVRQIKVFNGAHHYLGDWLALRGDAPGPLFLAINKKGAGSWPTA